MPSPMIHLDILFQLLDELKISPTIELLVGVLSPDAIHMRPNQTWEDKSKTHFYEEADQSYDLALKTATTQLTHLPNDFKKGYQIHLLTDYLWRENIYTPFFLNYKTKLTRPELHELYYCEMKTLDDFMITHATWVEEAIFLLSNPCPIEGFSLLMNEEITAWCHKVVTQDLNVTNRHQQLVLTVFDEHVIQTAMNQMKHSLKYLLKEMSPTQYV